MAWTSKSINKKLEPYAPWINKYSKEYGVDPNLVKAVIMQESRGIADADSGVAKGLMQLRPKTAEGLGVKDIFDPKQNIMGGAKYLSQQIDAFDSVKESLAAYNSGPGAVRSAMKKYDNYYAPGNDETRKYVPDVLNFYETLGDKTSSAQSEDKYAELSKQIEGAQEDLKGWSNKLPKVNKEAVEKMEDFLPYFAGIKVGGDLLDQTLKRIKVDERKDAIWSKQKTNFDIDKNNLMVGRMLFREGMPQVTRTQGVKVPQWKESKPLDAEKSLQEVGAMASNLQGIKDYGKFRKNILNKFGNVLKDLRDILG